MDTGLTLVGVSQPFDLIKVRMQNGNIAGSISFFNAAKTIVKTDGFVGLYRGIGPVAVGTPLILAVNIWAYSLSQRLVFGWSRFETINQLSLLQVGLAGLLGSIPTSLLVGPAELIKVRLQVASGTLSTAHIIRDAIRQGQATRGLGMTLARDCFGSFFYFMSYEGLKRLQRGEGRDLSPVAVLLSGGIAGCINWTIAMPFDNLKTRLQANPTHSLSGIMGQMNALGWRSYFTGLRPTLIRAFPASCAFFGGIEGCLWVFRQLE
ncbi:carnitine transporter [Kappamyces sp. JEL0829]|nr:carnitine transporter [Kappamyces sp. JEL0829]KAJ3367306.1 carnitine transporter [Kappamyces sp. JEL0680]